MNIVITGAPGAGKGTQAFKIVEKLNIPHISTGDIFRANIKGGTDLGKLAKSYIDKGQLVPDKVTCSIVEERLKEKDCENGFMLDGFPRTLEQAIALDKIVKIDKVINIDVDLNKLLKRLTGRRVCEKCGKSFHVSMYDGKNCDQCGGKILQRPDDTEVTVSQRLQVYVSQTEPLIKFYEEKGVLENINGSQDIDAVFADICKVLG